MQSKFHRFFSKTYLGDNLGPRLLCLFQFKDSGEGFCYSPSDQRSKDHCRKDSDHKCTCNNSTCESKNLKDFFYTSYI